MKKEEKKPIFKEKVHVIFCGNKTVIRASREAIGAMKYKSE